MAYKKIAIIGGITLMIIVMGVIVMTYVLHINSPLIVTIRTLLHLPAIIVDGRGIAITEIEENTASIKRFYENQDFAALGVRIDFSTEDGQKRLRLQEQKMLNKLVEDIAIEKIAREWQITLSDEAVQAAMDRPMDEMGTRDHVTENLDRLYGWTLDDFREKVVRAQLLHEKVAAKYDQENSVTEEMRVRMAQAQKELDDGRVFADVAAAYSEGSTATEGGVMGWFADDQLQDEIGKRIFTMDKEAYSDIIETPLGLHIVRVNDIAEKDGKKLVHVSQIVVKKKNFADYVSERLRKMDVRIFLPDYVWDAQKALVIFSDPEMVEFEKKMYEEAINVQKKLLEETKK